MMDLDYIALHDVVHRYASGELTEDELGQFELYYLENPDILDQVELDRSLKRGLQAHSMSLATSVQDQPQQSSLLSTLLSWFQIPQVVLGNLALVGLLFLTTVYQWQGQSAATAVATGPIISAQRLWVGTVRGAQPPLVSRSAKSGKLLLDIDVAASGQLNLQIVNNSGNTVVSLSALNATESGLVILTDMALFTPGDYQLLVMDSQGIPVVDRTLHFQAY